MACTTLLAHMRMKDACSFARYSKYVLELIRSSTFRVDLCNYERTRVLFFLKSKSWSRISEHIQHVVETGSLGRY